MGSLPEGSQREAVRNCSIGLFGYYCFSLGKVNYLDITDSDLFATRLRDKLHPKIYPDIMIQRAQDTQIEPD